MNSKGLFIAVALCGVNMLITPSFAAPIASELVPEVTIEVSSAPRRFDLMTVDTLRHRLLAAHSRAGTLTVINLDDNKLMAEVPVGRSAGVAVDTQNGKYFVGTTKGVAVVDPVTLKKVDFIATGAPADAMTYDPENGDLYAGHDDGKELWVIDARSDKITGTIAIPGAPELMEVDPETHRLYLNIKPLNEVAAIDPASGKIVKLWSSLPTKSPHGLAVDTNTSHLYVAGHSNMVSMFSLPTGVQGKGIDIGPGRVDQIALDDQARRLYCPSAGRLVIVKVSAGSNTVLGSVAIPKGTHSVAVDPVTHWVWISYADSHHSYVRAFAPGAANISTAYNGQEYAADARISITKARAIALKAYPGKITDQELEKETGGSGLRYSFDIEEHGVTHEVGVDAKTGELLENSKEGPHPD